jgi:hypothetical protein
MITVLGDVMWSSLADRDQYFGGACCLGLHSFNMKIEEADSSRILVYIIIHGSTFQKTIILNLNYIVISCHASSTH